MHEGLPINNENNEVLPVQGPAGASSTEAERQTAFNLNKALQASRVRLDELLVELSMRRSPREAQNLGGSAIELLDRLENDAAATETDLSLLNHMLEELGQKVEARAGLSPEAEQVVQNAVNKAQKLRVEVSRIHDQDTQEQFLLHIVDVEENWQKPMWAGEAEDINVRARIFLMAIEDLGDQIENEIKRQNEDKERHGA